MDSKTVSDINRCLRMIVNLFTNVYHSAQFRNYGGTKASDDFNKTIQMNKSTPRGDAGGLSREYVLRIPSVS